MKTKPNEIVKATKLLFIAGGLVLLIASYFNYTYVYMNNERRFWAAIERSMALPSVVRTQTQGTPDNRASQKYRFHYSPQQAIESVVRLNQESFAGTQERTTVASEGVLYADNQYLQYSEFESVNADGEKADVSDLLNTWAAVFIGEPTEADEAIRAQTKQSYASEYVNVVLFGNFPAEMRRAILDTMQKSSIYGDQLMNPVPATDTEVATDVYSVNINLKEYVTVLNNALRDSGVGPLDGLDPESVSDEPISGTVYVGRKSGNITRVIFNGREETYSDHGIVSTVERPTAELTITEMQERVREKLDANTPQQATDAQSE